MNIAIVDDDESTRLCFQDILQSSGGGFRLAGSFSTAAEALAEIPRLQPDLTLMDIRLPDLNGVECARRLRNLMPQLKIVMVTGTHTPDWVSASLQAGVSAYLVKPVVGDQLLATLRFAGAKETISEAGRKDKQGTNFRQKSSGGANFSLSPRETQVIAGLAEGLLYKEISEKLGISYSAVHKHQHNIFKKLHATNRSEAIRVWLDSHKS